MDLVLRNATIVDGTRAPRRRGDVGITGGRIVAVGDVAETGDREIDLDGLVLSPGFIDTHTHYDAQPYWDPSLSPSSWHGVTTVITGNCGFGIAPVRPDDAGHERVARLMESAEGMSIDALAAGIVWDFETFPEYLDSMDAKQPKLNMAALIGHSPLRLYVMGDDAIERTATPAELDRMCELLAEALDAGAFGFATSRSAFSLGAYGKPVPSRFADETELDRLIAVVGEKGGIVEVTPGPGLGFQEMADYSAKYDITFTWAGALTGFEEGGAEFTKVPELANTPQRMLEIQSGMGGRVYPQVMCRPLTGMFTLYAPTGSLSALPAFQKLMERPRSERVALYRDQGWLDLAREEVAESWKQRWPRVCIAESTSHPELIDVPLDQAAEQLGEAPFDIMVRVGLEDDGTTRYRVATMNNDEDEVGKVLDDPRSILGLADSGAHQSQTCDACFSTHLLGYWVREKEIMSLEDAVWRLSGQPAEVLGLQGRGIVAEGYAADLVAFDPATVGTTESERWYDLPAGADRVVISSTGIHHVWVNGEAIWSDGAEVADAAPGGIVR